MQPDGYLDLWARGHYKSTIITFAKTVQDILASHGDDPLPEWRGLEPTFGIFSHTRPIAKAFLRQIKTELEQNTVLQEVFPDVLYARPDRDSPRWSEDNGIVVKRRSNPKEATVEAWGLVDGQPTSKHFNVLVYDDVVTRESVNTPEMIQKTTEALELSFNLGDRAPRKRLIGTRYHFADSYREILKRQAARPRLHPATVDGTPQGEPVFLTREELGQKIREMGPYTSSAQLMQNPVADSKHTFRREWLRHYKDSAESWRSMNRALLVDPASSKKRGSDYTAIAVVGKNTDGGLYLLDAVRDRLNLRQRAEAVMSMHRRWKPQRAGYEQYGLQSDIEYIREMQERQNYRFDLEELGGRMAKADRVNRLIPFASEGKLWLPDALYRTNTDGKLEDLVQLLVEEELLPWPVPVHDDLADAIARVFDLENFEWPMGADEGPPKDRYRQHKPRGTWMSR